MRLKPIETRKAYREIIDQVEELIARGELQPGDKLPSERELVSQLNVSRPTVREALSALEMVGLVESRPGQGRFIKAAAGNIDRETLAEHLTDSRPFELLEARITIESGTARIAARKADAEDLKRLEEQLGRMAALIRSGQMALAADSDFHFAIARITRNNFLKKTMKHIVSAMNSASWKQLKQEAMRDPDTRRNYLEDHKKIFRAIKESRTDRAGLYMQAHLTKVFNDLLPENGRPDENAADGW